MRRDAKGHAAGAGAVLFGEVDALDRRSSLTRKLMSLSVQVTFLDRCVATGAKPSAVNSACSGAGSLAAARRPRSSRPMGLMSASVMARSVSCGRTTRIPLPCKGRAQVR